MSVISKRVHSEGSLSLSCQKSAYFSETLSQTDGQSCIFSLGMLFQSFATVLVVYLVYSNLNYLFFFFVSPNVYKNKKNRTNCKCSLIVTWSNPELSTAGGAGRLRATTTGSADDTSKESIISLISVEALVLFPAGKRFRICQGLQTCFREGESHQHEKRKTEDLHAH